jgi:hypothetical protein
LPAVITHKAALILQLINATDGSMVTIGGVRFQIDNAKTVPISKGNGYYVFLDELPETYLLEIYAPHFEPFSLQTGLADTAKPMAAELIPDRFGNCLTLEGTRKGLDALDAVRLDDNICLIEAVDPRKKTITVINPHKLALDRPRYAAVCSQKETYETFTIVERISDAVLKIDRSLQANGSTISAVIPGAVSSGGHYLLRARDSFPESRHIVRMTLTGGREVFRVVDFRHPEPLAL